MNILGIDIGGTKISLCVGDETGRIVTARRFATRPERGPAVVRDELVAVAGEVMAEAGLAAGAVDAVGLAAPGPLSVERGAILGAPNMPGWDEVPIRAWIREAFDRPVYLNNDANACALAEHLFGARRGTQDLVYLTMSTGIGAGVVAGGRVIQGASDTAGEVGHHVLDPQGPPCPCGQRGCWEAFCGGRTLAERLRRQIASDRIATAILDRAGGDPERIDFRCLLEAAREGDPFALEVWDAYVERTAQGVGTVLMMYNPSAVIMGTIAIHAGAFLLEPLARALPRYAWGANREACAIEASALGTQIGDLSALALAVSGARECAP